MSATKTNLYAANSQWASRPKDERFWTVQEMLNYLRALRDNSEESKQEIRQLRCVNATETEDVLLLDKDDRAITFTNHSFGQLCGKIGAPADYLRGVSGSLAARCLNYGLAQRRKAKDDESAQLLISHNGDGASLELRSLTTALSRLWSAEVVESLLPLQQQGWMLPPARPSPMGGPVRKATLADIVPGQDKFGLSVKEGDDIGPAGAYANDKGMFLFLVLPSVYIDDGKQGLMKGVFVENSEVGAGKLTATAFYLENVCGNHIVWGASNVVTVSKVHKGNSSFGMKLANREMVGQLEDYANRPASFEQKMIADARNLVLGKDFEEVKETILDVKRKTGHVLTGDQLKGGWNLAIEFEDTAGSAPNTLWGMHHGLTRYSQQFTGNSDVRTALDRSAGNLLKLVSAN